MINVIDRKIILLWILLFILVLADGTITYLLITRGIAGELNPVLAGNISNNVFMILKFGGGLLAVSILANIAKRNYNLSFITSGLFTFFFLGIVLWNSSLLITATGN